jgi:hypothetical protein
MTSPITPHTSQSFSAREWSVRPTTQQVCFPNSHSIKVKQGRKAIKETKEESTKETRKDERNCV